MTLACHAHVLVAVEPHLDGALEAHGGEGGEGAKVVALCLFATKAPTHTSGLYHHTLTRDP